MTRKGFRYASLHGDSLRQSEKPPEPSDPIFALPKGSSSDEEFGRLEVLDDETSDDSEFGRSEKKKPVGIGMLRTSTHSSPANGEDGKKRELSVETSNIRPGSFTSGKGSGSRNGSQSSQKRKNADLDDDDMPFAFSQSKKPRQGYGSTNIHRGPVTKPGNPKKLLPKESEKPAPAFKKRDISAMEARVDRLHTDPKIPKRPRSRGAPSLQTSPRAQRASQRSVKSTQESSQSSSRSFKQPPRPSPKEPLKFKAGPVICEEVDPPRATRSSAPAKRPPVVIEANALGSSKLQNAFNTATDKLGISLPLSATRDSSVPPTSLDAATTVSSPLSSLDDSTLGSSQEGVPIITSKDIPIYTAESRPAVCPMCKQPVDQSYLEAFTKAGTRMSLRQQTQFCKAHKERSAESEWAERGYPKIDWQQLDDRIATFHTSMDDILSRRKFSFYRNAFEDSLKSGRKKTIQESLMGGDEIEGTSPGYYGGRGAKVMADNIMSRFASKLRRLAASDKLISSGGVSRYVQAVLVPEMAVLLVMDDMKVDEEKAKEVLRDSVDIGNLLNEEEDEIITDPAPKEQEVVDMT